MKTINDILKHEVSSIDDDPITIDYLKNCAYSDRLMTRSLRGWLKEYLAIKAKRQVAWRSRKKVDPTGGDLVRIWTEDLKGTKLEDDCDFVVWQMPDDTVGKDFARFLTGLKLPKKPQA